MSEESKSYKFYGDSKYVILETGEVARMLKPTFIHRQTYFNLILNGKMKRMNKQDLAEMFKGVKPDEQGN